MSETQSIYALVDPNTDEIRYIGRSNDPQSRLINHLNNAKLPTRRWRVPSPIVSWLRELISNDIQPSLKILEDCIPTIDKAIEREGHWIDCYLEAGAGLLNVHRPNGPNIKHSEYYHKVKREMVEKAAPSFLAKQKPGEPFNWDGMPRWLRGKVYRYLRTEYQEIPPQKRLAAALNNYDFSELPLDKLKRIAEIIDG